MATQISSQFSWILFGRVLAAALQAVLIVMLARALGPADFGLLSAVLGIIMVLQAVFDLGLRKMVLRERAEGSTPPIVAGGLWLNSVSSISLGISVGVLLLILGLLVDPIYYFMVPLAFCAAAEKNADTWLGIALADGDAKINTFNLVGRRAVALLLFLGLLQFKINFVLGYSLAVSVAAIVSVLFARSIVKEASTGERASIRETFIVARPYWANTLAAQLRNLDVAVVNATASSSAAGFYATAARLSGPLRMLPTSLGTVLLPRAAQSKGASLAPIIRILVIAGPLFALMYLLLALLAPWLVETALGDEYIPVIEPLQIVLFGLVFAAITSLVQPVLQGLGFQRAVAIIAVLTTVLILVGLLALSSPFGEVGAAMALAVGFAFECVALLIVTFIRLPKRKGPQG